MAYLLGSKACIESLLIDVQDIHWTVRDIISRTGPLNFRSWKFPDQSACDVDIDDLLDLYSCDDDDDDDEEKQVAHIALYELVIDRLLLLVQATAKYADTYLGSGQISTQDDEDSKKVAGSVGLVVRQFWTHLSKLQTLYQQLQSENKSRESKIHQLEKELHKPPEGDIKDTHSVSSLPPVLDANNSSYPKTPGTLGLIPPNKADMIFMGLASPSDKQFSISLDTNNKASQTYDTCLVPCESCEFVQRKMREAGDIVIKVCSDQGLPCSLKKFKSEVAHVETLMFGDVCRWMAEQNKDIARIGKQSELLQASIDPLKKEVKACGRKVKEAEENAKLYETNMKEEKHTQAILRKQLEVKMKSQEEQHQQLLDEEARQKSELGRAKEKLEQEMKQVKKELEEQEENLKALELEYKVLDKELKEKCMVAVQVEGLQDEVSTLKLNLAEVKEQLDNTTKALALERGKGRSASEHNESLQAKQESLLSRMERLGQENENLTEQVASLEERKASFDDLYTELKMEAKDLRKKVKENKVIIHNLESEKKSLAASVKESQEMIRNLESKIEESKERERMIVEYPDLNGPVNPDLSGTGDIVLDMQNQVKANSIRMKLLEEQNSGLSQSILKLTHMSLGGGFKSEPKSTPMQPIPLWQQDRSINDSHFGNEINYFPHSEQSKVHQLDQQLSLPPTVKQHAWTFDRQNTNSAIDSQQGKHVFPEPSQEFVVGYVHPPNELSGKSGSSRRPSSVPRQGRPSSAKTRTVNAPVNATPIGAYTQMKQALGILSGMERPKKARPSSSKISSSKPPIHMPHPEIYDAQRDKGQDHSSPFSCPRCDKMYLKGRDLEIHLTYCASAT
ncbi:coiled-coil domain-containing protein 157-like isoform x1 [Plakobranchus ocellatus]|uniref:Coiled-coil domain-containing protein 157-like isoform x1 n=1 Tax=Plakobranchus ocellatus TaxID=259542 RepID=A0AAV4AFA7_9GAST|nr:coiled-coil domain-containing protein 157-like isoform x1 [Plakobranchus ocellatus]